MNGDKISDPAPAPKLTLKSLEDRIDALEQQEPAASTTSTDVIRDLVLGVVEALKCAGINTAARMAEELESKYGLFDEELLESYPWMVDYR